MRNLQIRSTFQFTRRGLREFIFCVVDDYVRVQVTRYLGCAQYMGKVNNLHNRFMWVDCK